MVPKKWKDDQIDYKIYVIENEDQDGKNLFKKLKEGEYKCRFRSRNMPIPSQRDLSFVERLEFDNNMRYLIGFGGTSFIQLELNTGEAQVYNIRRGEKEYEKILDLNFTSTADSNEFNRCQLACKIAKMNQISVFDFDYMKTANYQQQQNVHAYRRLKRHRKSVLSLGDQSDAGLLPRESQPTNVILEEEECGNRKESIINFKNNPTHLKVKISRDFKKILFTDDKEKFILKRSGQFYQQTELKLLNDKIVMFVKEEIQQPGEHAEAGGFYVLCCNKFDDKISLIKISLPLGEDRRFDVEFKRRVEPGIVQVFDMSVDRSKLEDDLETEVKQIKVISLDDDEFMLDRASWTEKKVNEQDNEDHAKVKASKRENFKIE